MDFQAHANLTSIAIITKVVTLGTPCHEWTTSLQLSQLAIDGCTYRYDLRMIEGFRSDRHMLSFICREKASYRLKYCVTDPKELIPLIAVIDSRTKFFPLSRPDFEILDGFVIELSLVRSISSNRKAQTKIVSSTCLNSFDGFIRGTIYHACSIAIASKAWTSDRMSIQRKKRIERID